MPEKRDVAALAQADRTSQLHVDTRHMKDRFAGPPEPEISRPASLQKLKNQRLGLDWICWAGDGHVREHRHDAQILDPVMGISLCAIRQPAAHRDDRHRQVVIANVIAQLFEAAQRREVRDRINHHPAARERKTGSDTHHRLLANADIRILPRQRLCELLQHRVADVGGQQHDFRVGARIGHQRRDRLSAHEPPPIVAALHRVERRLDCGNARAAALP